MKVAIVTGVLGGIGKASAVALAKNGYRIVGMGRKTSHDLTELNALGTTCLSGDISSPEDRKKLVDAAVSYGDICVLVNVAGVAPKVRRDILEMTEESYDYVMGINTKGTLFLTQLVANEKLGAESLGLVFLKGYQWPFDTGKVAGSSKVDLLVAEEIKGGNRVYLDFLHNPKGLEQGFAVLPEEAYTYLANSGAHILLRHRSPRCPTPNFGLKRFWQDRERG